MNSLEIVGFMTSRICGQGYSMGSKIDGEGFQLHINNEKGLALVSLVHNEHETYVYVGCGLYKVSFGLLGVDFVDEEGLSALANNLMACYELINSCQGYADKLVCAIILAEYVDVYLLDSFFVSDVSQDINEGIVESLSVSGLRPILQQAKDILRSFGCKVKSVVVLDVRMMLPGE